ncbi:MAG: DNA/RNA nuclease SfsA [Planctomycetes bacterium]|nr:DNA/RNA nuclease SfsA [Planctomycetota bacterium]
MRFPSPLVPGRLIRRYKRFLADIELDNGKVLTAHCANPGSMMGCDLPGLEVRLSRSDRPGRKLPYTLELVRAGDTWIGVNTSRTNAVLEEALVSGLVPELVGFRRLRREVAYGSRSRVDFLLEFPGRLCFVEAKNVTLARGDTALFPDSVTSRGTRHLVDLAERARAGDRAVMFYLVNREDCHQLAPAVAIDPVYAQTLAKAVRAGVQILAYRALVAPEGIRVSAPVKFVQHSAER